MSQAIDGCKYGQTERRDGNDEREDLRKKKPPVEAELFEYGWKEVVRFHLIQ